MGSLSTGTRASRRPLGKCSELEDINRSVVGTTSSTAIPFVCYAANSGASSKAYPVREIAKSCRTITTPQDAGATVEVVIADAKGVVIDGEAVTGDYHARDLPLSENDDSIALRILYGDFIFSTAGDLDGENSVSAYGYKYHNIETPVRKIVGVVGVDNANHHGSSHSSNKDYVDTLQQRSRSSRAGRATGTATRRTRRSTTCPRGPPRSSSRRTATRA